MQDQSCAIIIPVYNEEKVIETTVKHIQSVIAEVKGWDFKIYCINDGSSDKTAERLAALDGIEVITHRANRGYGAALKTGLNQSESEWVFICDADATYPIEDLPKLINHVTDYTDMVIGARRGIGITRNPLKRIARWILRKMTHALTGTMVPDLNSGMRVFKRQLYTEFRNLLPMGFSFTTTITMASLYAGYEIVYVPIKYNTRVGKSNIKPISDFLGFSMLIIRIAAYFEPLRFFLPLSFTILFLGIAKAIRDFILLESVGSLAVTLSLMGIQIFAIGVLAEVIVRRSPTYTPKR